MRFANIFLGLNCPKFPYPQVGGDLADGVSLRLGFGKSHQETVRKLVAAFVVINIGHNHFDRPRSI